jgi:hypothetical protein
MTDGPYHRSGLRPAPGSSPCGRPAPNGHTTTGTIHPRAAVSSRATSTTARSAHDRRASKNALSTAQATLVPLRQSATHATDGTKPTPSRAIHPGHAVNRHPEQERTTAIADGQHKVTDHTARSRDSNGCPGAGCVTPFRGVDHRAPDLLQLRVGNFATVHLKQSSKTTKYAR